ncbi:MAG: 3'(2'),5'-bisphosphate nucleotidase CysQ [Pseudomonadota bacterium]
MPETDPDRSLSVAEEREALIGAARLAGEVALQFFRQQSLQVWSKTDRSPVSEADLKANQVLQEALLHGAREDYGWLSEESADDPARLKRDRLIIVDPIDGTRAFIKGDARFTICLAIVEAGCALASVVYAPALEELYAAGRGLGAELNGKPIKVSPAQDLSGTRMVGLKRMFDDPRWPQPWPPMAISYTNSTSLRLANVASGAQDAMIALARKADWDAAPGSLLVEEAGGRATDHLGRPLLFGQADPHQSSLVGTTHALYPQVIERLAHLPGDLSALHRR